ncbi:MurR/RpiR family transcriptional regulator [Cohaesibacter haloalkalitolerans]|uniref:MurR/RpiR family transcriptional regulator n=1 Tax=Cohaesibacter haloalkalitolerans TaxID=1162980 RepID=UPI0013C452DD|nr:MurR/RpiR family transcriptional regulator [Cohaesibacter haloalkalitolerans]
MGEIEAPVTVADLESRVVEMKDSLPKRLQECASFFLRKGDAMAFLTVAQASLESGIAASTFIRFAQALGMQGYSDLQQLYRRNAFHRRPSYRYRINTLRQRGETEPEQLLMDFCDTSISSIERLVNSIRPELIEEAAEIISSAPELHIMGFKRAFSIASYLAYVLGQFDHRVILHTNVGAIKTIKSFRPGEVVLFISFEPYTPEIVELAEQARRDGAKILAISDTPLSPLTGFSDVCLGVVEEEVGAFRTFSATYCLAATLAVLVGTRMNSDAMSL